MAIVDEDHYDKIYKILIMGDTNVGKTSLLLRYTENDFSSEGIATLGVDVKNKFLSYEQKKIRLDIWDTAGQERFKGLAKSYIKGGHGFVFVFSLTDKNSFYNLKTWINDVKSISSNTYKMIVIGNKNDCKNVREITEKNLNDFKEKYDVKVFEASAKTGEGVEEAFNALVQLLYECQEIGDTDENEDDRSYSLDKGPLTKKKKQNCGC